ncbi:hypothetical protein FIBSPDRAFT_965134, partial [Athelia psychrophila]
VAVAKQNPYRSAGKPPPAPALVKSSLAQLDVVNVPPATEEPRPSQRPFPPLPLHSRQHVGETPHDFIARSAIKCEGMDPARRRNRESAHAKHQLPGKGGPVVFIWANVDGYLIRNKLDRKEVEVEWEAYMDGQRRYNVYYNEWDLAEAFAPEEDAAADEDEDESLYHSYMGLDDPSMITLPAPAMDTSSDAPRPSSLIPANFCDVLALVYDPLQPITALKGLQSLELVMYNRYGFTWRKRPNTYDRKTILGHSLPPEKWETTRKIVCDTASKWNPIVKDLEVPFSDFVQCFLGDTVPVLPLLWDLSPTNSQYIFSKGHKALTLMTYGQDTVYRIGFGSDTDSTTECSTIDGVLGPSYVITVSDPLTALEWVRRRSWTTPRDFLEHCLATGKPFMTLSQSWQLQGPQNTDFARYPQPGYRKAGWQPDTLEFRHYETSRKEFLLRIPRARAAASYGGILW